MASKHEVEERVQVAEELIVKGLGDGRAARLLRDKLRISLRQARRYVNTAHGNIRQMAGVDREQEVARALQVYRKLLQDPNPHIVIKAQRAIDRLLGLRVNTQPDHGGKEVAVTLTVAGIMQSKAVQDKLHQLRTSGGNGNGRRRNGNGTRRKRS